MIDKRAFMSFYVTYLPKTFGGGIYWKLPEIEKLN